MTAIQGWILLGSPSASSSPRCSPHAARQRLAGTLASLQPRIDEFLLALEAQSMAPKLAHRAHAILERMILAHAKAALPRTVGDVQASGSRLRSRLPTFSPLAGRTPPMHRRTRRQRLSAHLSFRSARGRVPSYVLADAIAAEFAWPILGRFFERTVYRDLSIEREPTGLSLRRGDPSPGGRDPRGRASVLATGTQSHRLDSVLTGDLGVSQTGPRDGSTAMTGKHPRLKWAGEGSCTGSGTAQADSGPIFARRE